MVGATYRIIATETVGGITSAPQTVDVNVVTTFVELAFTPVSVNQACANTSNASVNVTAGTAATTLAYSIISGPVVRAPQTSNVFNGLPVGSYVFQVLDICGNTKTMSAITKYQL